MIYNIQSTWTTIEFKSNGRGTNPRTKSAAARTIMLDDIPLIEKEQPHENLKTANEQNGPSPNWPVPVRGDWQVNMSKALQGNGDNVRMGQGYSKDQAGSERQN
jgi:hypothetical protein